MTIEKDKIFFMPVKNICSTWTYPRCFKRTVELFPPTQLRANLGDWYCCGEGKNTHTHTCTHTIHKHTHACTHTHRHAHTHMHIRTHARMHARTHTKQKQSVSLPLSGHATWYSRNARALSGPLSQCNTTSWSRARNSQVD